MVCFWTEIRCNLTVWQFRSAKARDVSLCQPGQGQAAQAHQTPWEMHPLVILLQGSKLRRGAIRIRAIEEHVQALSKSGLSIHEMLARIFTQRNFLASRRTFDQWLACRGIKLQSHQLRQLREPMGTTRSGPFETEIVQLPTASHLAGAQQGMSWNSL